MFQMKGIVYQKSGQFFWEASPVVGSPKRLVILRHHVYSPDGIWSIDHCGWDRDDWDELFPRIKAANETWSQMLPIDAVSEDYPSKVKISISIRISMKKVLISLCGWGILFYSCCFFAFVRKNWMTQSKKVTFVSESTYGNRCYGS